MNALRSDMLNETSNLQRQITWLRNKSDDYGTRVLRLEHDTEKIHESLDLLRQDMTKCENNIITLQTVKLEVKDAEHSFKKVSSHLH